PRYRESFCHVIKKNREDKSRRDRHLSPLAIFYSDRTQRPFGTWARLIKLRRSINQKSSTIPHLASRDISTPNMKPYCIPTRLVNDLARFRNEILNEMARGNAATNLG